MKDKVYAKCLTDDEKTECLRYFLLNRLDSAGDSRLTSLALEHELSLAIDEINPIAHAISSLKDHRCKPSCLIREEDAHFAHVHYEGETRMREERETETDEEDCEFWKANWPQVEDQSTLDEVDI